MNNLALHFLSESPWQVKDLREQRLKLILQVLRGREINLIKVGEHFAENNVWAKGAIAKREERLRKHGALALAARSAAAKRRSLFKGGVSEDGK